jgi:hypothetical protein
MNDHIRHVFRTQISVNLVKNVIAMYNKAGLEIIYFHLDLFLQTIRNTRCQEVTKEMHLEMHQEVQVLQGEVQGLLQNQNLHQRRKPKEVLPAIQVLSKLQEKRVQVLLQLPGRKL